MGENRMYVARTRPIMVIVSDLHKVRMAAPEMVRCR
jgi:hypothetical protein